MCNELSYRFLVAGGEDTKPQVFNEAATRKRMSGKR